MDISIQSFFVLFRVPFHPLKGGSEGFRPGGGVGGGQGGARPICHSRPPLHF